MSAATYASMALQRVEDALQRLDLRPRAVPSGLHARCPAHEDSTPSLSVGSRDDGQGVVVRCHAGCTAGAIVDALGLRLADLFDQPRSGDQQGAPAPAADVCYRYVDEHGQLLFEVVRKPGKQFRQRVPDGQGGWVWKLGDTRRVLYRLPEVLAAVAAGQPVYVVEGEKDADRLHREGVVATCNPAGAGKWRADYAEHLAGATVVVIADRDEPGRKHAEDVRASLAPVARSVTLLEAAHGKDASDHLDAGLTLAQLIAPGGTSPVDAAPPRYTAIDWRELFSRDRTIEVEWLCEPLLEVGRVTALYSKAKAGKSLLTLDVVAALAAGRSVLGQRPRARVSVLYVDLENSEDDIWERLRDMGYGPEGLAELHYYSFPDLPALDSAHGGAELLRLAQLHSAQVVVIDTTSRVITGEEDSADTFRALYRHALMPLKRERRAVLRLDHSGKDATAGQRGSSAKNDAEDYVWFLTATPAGRIDLRRTHSRTRHGADQFSLRRLTEPKLRHVPTRDGIAPDVQRVLDILEELGVPADHGRDRVKKALTEAGYGFGTTLLAEVLRVRRDPTVASAELAADLSSDLSCDLEQPMLPESDEDLSSPSGETAGQTCPGQVEDSQDSHPAVPADDLSSVLPLLEGGQDGQPTPPDSVDDTCVCRFDLPAGDHFDYCQDATSVRTS